MNPTPVTQADLAEVMSTRARAEAAEWTALLDFVEPRRTAVDSEAESVFGRQADINALMLTAGQALHLSEGQVSHRISVATRVRDDAPLCWAAFGEGRIDGSRVREIAHAIEKLTRGDSRAKFDARAADYAAGHTLAELRRWLKRLVARLEPNEFEERATAARDERHVEVFHGDDAMGYLILHHTSPVLAAIDKRLNKDALALGSDDPRTKEQRRADLAAAWLTTNESGEAAINANIAVVLEAVAESSDGAWQVPNSWVAEMAATGNPFWHRMVVDPVIHDVLSFESIGYQPADSLATAIQFRDGTCRAPGCLKPADQCDLDHRQPWPAGPTSGDNLWALCRRHHQMKGHKSIRWLLLDYTEINIEYARAA